MTKRLYLWKPAIDSEKKKSNTKPRPVMFFLVLSPLPQKIINSNSKKIGPQKKIFGLGYYWATLGRYE